MSKTSPLQRVRTLTEWWAMFSRNRKYKPKKRQKINISKEDDD